MDALRKLFDWSKPRTWMLSGLLILVALAVFVEIADAEESGGVKLVGAAGGIMLAIGAFTAAVLHGMKSDRKRDQ